MYTMYLSATETGVWEYELFLALADFVRDMGIPLAVEPVETVQLKRWWGSTRTIVLNHSLAFLQHHTTGRFHVLDCSDWVTPFEFDLRDVARDPRCRVILKAQYQPEPYRKRPLTKVKPWTYFETHPSHVQSNLEVYRCIPRDHELLFFRGNTTWEGRAAILSQLSAAGVIDPDFEESVAYRDYLPKIARHRIALGLPGMGNLCHREIEAFGIGTPVLMPRLKNTTHRDLIPDYHYISVDVDTLTDEPGYVADQIARRFHQVAADQSYLDCVARAAMAWYEANVRFPNSLALTAQLLGLLS